MVKAWDFDSHNFGSIPFAPAKIINLQHKRKMSRVTVLAWFLKVNNEEERARTCTNRRTFDANVLLTSERKD